MNLPASPRRPRNCALATAVLLAVIATGEAAPPSGGTYVLRAAAVDASGTRAVDAQYVLRTASGQAQAGPLEGGSYRLSVGVLTPSIAASSPPDSIFLDGFETP